METRIGASGAAALAFALAAGATLPFPVQAAEPVPDLFGKKLSQSIGQATLRIEIGKPDQSMSVPLHLVFENRSKEPVCFDRIQIRGLGNGQQAMVFSVFRTGVLETSSTAQNKGQEAPPLQTKIFWRIPGQAGISIPTLFIKSVAFEGALHQELRIRLMFNPNGGPDREGCGAAPADPFVFAGK